MEIFSALMGHASEVSIDKISKELRPVLIDGEEIEDAGVKSSQTETDNVADYFSTVNSVTSPDYEKTNPFTYKETIHKAYTNSSYVGKRWSMQFVLR